MFAHQLGAEPSSAAGDQQIGSPGAQKWAGSGTSRCRGGSQSDGMFRGLTAVMGVLKGMMELVFHLVLLWLHHAALKNTWHTCVGYAAGHLSMWQLVLWGFLGRRGLPKVCRAWKRLNVQLKMLDMKSSEGKERHGKGREGDLDCRTFLSPPFQVRNLEQHIFLTFDWFVQNTLNAAEPRRAKPICLPACLPPCLPLSLVGLFTQPNYVIYLPSSTRFTPAHFTLRSQRSTLSALRFIPSSVISFRSTPNYSVPLHSILRQPFASSLVHGIDLLMNSRTLGPGTRIASPAKMNV